jgi:hypothetical protein
MPITMTAGQGLAHIDATIATLGVPRHRAMLGAFRTHWHGEITGDLDAAMSVVHEDSRFAVVGDLAAGEAFEVTGVAAHRAIYQMMPDMGLNAGGAFSEARFAFAHWGIVMEAVYANVVYGGMLANVGDYDPQALFLFHAPLVMVCQFDAAVRMTHKRDYFARVVSVEPADLATLAALTALD